MKNPMLIWLLLLSSLTGYAQAPSYHWEINGVPVPGATSVAFITTVTSHADSAVSLNDSITYKQVAFAGKMLHRYKGYHITGNVLEIMGVTAVTANLIEMNRRNDKATNYIPIYVVGGALAAAGYIINEWICPAFINKAGLSLQGNTLNIDLH